LRLTSPTDRNREAKRKGRLGQSQGRALIADISKLAATLGRVTNPDIAHARRSVRAQLYMQAHLDHHRARDAHCTAVDRIVHHHEHQQCDTGRSTTGERLGSVFATGLYTEPRERPQSLNAAATEDDQRRGETRTRRVLESGQEFERPVAGEFELEGPRNLSEAPDRLEPSKKKRARRRSSTKTFAVEQRRGQAEVLLSYGAVSADILYPLHALLGACVFLLRLFSNELSTGTFSPTYANRGASSLR
jgi:hypothetical protein